MRRKRARAPLDISADPFRERRRAALHERIQLLGGQFHFETDSPRLLHIARHAYAGLPPHRFRTPAPRFTVRLLLTTTERPRRAIDLESEPPPVRPLAGVGILCGAMDSANFMTVSPQQRSAVVVV